MENILNQMNDSNEKVKILTEEELATQWDLMTREDRIKACLYQKFSLAFVKDHVKEISWPHLSVNPNITFEILDTFPRKISWKSICVNAKKLSDAFLYNYRLRLEWDIILCKQQLGAEILVRLAEAFRKSSLKSQKEKFWKAVSRFQEMDIPFIDAYKRYINMDLLSGNTMIGEEILQNYITELNYDILMQRTDLSKPFIVKNGNLFLKDENVLKKVREKRGPNAK